MRSLMLSFFLLSIVWVNAQDVSILGKKYGLTYSVQIARSYFVPPVSNDYYMLSLNADSTFQVSNSKTTISGRFKVKGDKFTLYFKNGTSKEGVIQIVDENEIIITDDKNEKEYLFVIP